MRRTIINRTFLIALLSLFMLTGCQKDDDNGSGTGANRQEVKVAVVLPMSSGMQQRWERTIGWALQNIEAAQKNVTHGVKLTIEWYDEDVVNIEKTIKELASREDIAAIVGPMYSANAMIASKLCARSRKTLITTTASSAELIRASANKTHFWALTETDISQCEVLLSKAMLYGAKRVSLLAKEDVYGQTFVDWFAFQAKELGLEVVNVGVYTDATVKSVFKQCAAELVDYLICVPSSTDNLELMLQAWAESKGMTARLLFSDVAYSSALLEKYSTLAEGIEGVAMSSDPTSGFAISYEVKYDEQPVLGEAQAYDAMMLIAYASFYMQLSGETDMNNSLCHVVDGRDGSFGSWMAEDMRITFDAFAGGKSPDIKGASGSLNFDAKVYTNVLYSVYASWMVYQGKFIILDYNTCDGGNRTDATLSGWNWKNSQSQEFDGGSPSISYPPLKEQWALIVAASEGWRNYRHQADALEMYRLLKQQGYTDDRIVLIMEDDIASNPNNPNKGVIKVRPTGENLYTNVKIDYKLSAITPSDIASILRGEKGEKLPEVIAADESDNVLVFWSGHGAPGHFVWGEYGQFTNTLMQQTLQSLSEQKKYRKMLWLVETCYAGSVAVAAKGIPGVMFITASNENETSKADIYNDELGVWMTNRYTSTLDEQISENPAIPLRDLYFKLFRNTVGSHVTVYNQGYFDNIYQCTMEEFL